MGERMGTFKAIGLSMVYLMTVVNAARSEGDSYLRSFGFVEKDYRFILGIGTGDGQKVICLGSIVTNIAVLTLASCFDAYGQEEGHTQPVVSYKSDEEPIKHRENKTLSKLSSNRHRKRRLWSHIRKKSYNQTADPDDSEENDPVKYSLFRIDAELKAFVRLNVDGKLAKFHHYDYYKLKRIQMWKLDIAFIFTDKPLNSSRIRLIPLATLKFGDYIKSLHEQTVNTMSCQVIGLIEYSDNSTYSAWDTQVELVAHDVLLVYDECNNTVCFENEESCLDTGHHIHKDPTNPMPYFVGGSPLVCGEKILSVVNIHSHCDDRKYLAEFAQPDVVREFLRVYQLVEDEKSEESIIPRIPRPQWAIQASPRGAEVLNSLHLAFAMILNLL